MEVFAPLDHNLESALGLTDVLKYRGRKCENSYLGNQKRKTAEQ